ncbi:UDP-N-acetylmuramoyl-L-alanine--D-glutamate ligase [Agrococcus sp. SCSIO52902]|uniref:UDP-N-acetylmuramoyl-L-alanine--D-glutamate ligase n=1 Tax=Agrococcus sp. SCSIO52902 TaxID=2933290 RepID=UPI001FF12330|nr:UDP-N-acetylmuramoyl-L-alanine--D-glutamate ligase [Agrococcus sp. SCSIO52902]UOW00217.1 UDP-N-acetylmuramoyl-L-alanine--D-glutamate ligase [Agrococcus sp. SCSIO52902]
MRDLDSLTSWRSDWSGLRVAVLGLGVTGFAAVDTLAELGASVTAVAERVDDERRTILGVLGVPIVDAAAAEVPEALAGAELVIASPGLRPDHPWLLAAAERGIPVWGDIELAWRVRDKVRAAEWILVTGTNGKTTTTQLTAHMLREAGFRVAPVGNIGTPVLDAVRDPEGFDALVLELSSFQLHGLAEEGPGALWPHSAACLNIDDDHLDWHGSADAYRAAKAKVYRNARVAAVYNVEDPATMAMVEEADVVEGCRAIGFGLGVPGRSDLGIVDGVLVDRAFLDDRHRQALELGTLDDLVPGGLRSPHMARNVLAAAALARAFGAEPAHVRDAIRSFRLDRHRTELVAEVDGVRWVDDSKATNPHAAEGSLSAFDRVVWIVGGLFKGADVAPLVERHAGRIVAAVAIGVERAPVREAFARHAPGIPLVEVSTADTGAVMRLAVEEAAAHAAPGVTVLLAPAAASMDQFDDYADRGDRFAEAVRGRGAHGDDDRGPRAHD